MRKWEGDLPLFILGNSLGGLVVLDYALHYPAGLRGVIAAAPPLGEVGVPPFLMTLGRVMSRIWPRFSLEVGMDLSGLARDPAVVDTMLADPLFHRRGTARLSTEVTAAIQRVQARAETSFRSPADSSWLGRPDGAAGWQPPVLRPSGADRPGAPGVCGGLSRSLRGHGP